ncbi:Lycopene cyclase [Acaryochloris thomasi RCC1774]|uniref:Lycopene cyclase n=1 Tax=Acaryochloris thomasi RCC1774 TaxID=1764569 RepID=A0A2W1JAU5_9CYAN|nr:FAD-dependent monooxygenase [Acaryochloris thomasi]PZD71249.1 Lycopene cyclase [Acaryochloris thomasi RCC1774]
MKQLLYLEIPTPDTDAVHRWLHLQCSTAGSESCVLQLNLKPSVTLSPTSTGLKIQDQDSAVVFYAWQHLRTTYVKANQWSERPVSNQAQVLDTLVKNLREAFPQKLQTFPEIDLSQTDIFAALQPHYPLTAKYFQAIPNGEADLQRAYWWEKRWRHEVGKSFDTGPDQDLPIVQQAPVVKTPDSVWDVVIVGGALGVLSGAMLARLGYRVALVERIKFGRMNREWNISRTELQTLVDVGLLTVAELESLIAREYRDNFNLFFSGNNAPNARAPVLTTPTVLNIAMDCDRLLQLCGEKLVAAGGQILELTEFEQAYLEDDKVTIRARNLETDQVMHLESRLLIDAMGTASRIAQQMNPGQAFDSVCPTIGGVVKNGFAPGVWDHDYGEPLLTNGDISRGRQLIWEMFPGHEQDLTIYLFYYHQIRPDNPGSLLELFEDFFHCLPEYRRCDLERLEWRKAAFGYIPGRFSRNAGDRPPGCDRILSIGDSASLSSPLIFTGFGSLVRNLPRVTHLLDIALQHDLLTGKDLSRINAYQDNLAVTWIFSRGMMVPPNSKLSPNWINSTLNTFFGVLTEESPQEVDDFIKDRGSWSFMTRNALIAGWRNPMIPIWVVQSMGWTDFSRWVGTYITFTWASLMSFLFGGWLPELLLRWQDPMVARWPRLWHRLLAWSYRLTYGMGRPRLQLRLPSAPAATETNVSQTVSEVSL